MRPYLLEEIGRRISSVLEVSVRVRSAERAFTTGGKPCVLPLYKSRHSLGAPQASTFALAYSFFIRRPRGRYRDGRVTRRWLFADLKVVWLQRRSRGKQGHDIAARAKEGVLVLFALLLSLDVDASCRIRLGWVVVPSFFFEGYSAISAGRPELPQGFPGFLVMSFPAQGIPGPSVSGSFPSPAHEKRKPPGLRIAERRGGYAERLLFLLGVEA